VAVHFGRKGAGRGRGLGRERERERVRASTFVGMKGVVVDCGKGETSRKGKAVA
jgi:hypothetical protein